MIYKLHKVGVLRLADNAVIPSTIDNLDWQKYQSWLAQGNTPLPQDPDPSPIDFSNSDNLEKSLKALGLVVAAWSGKTPAQLRVAFKTAYASLP